MTPLLTGVFASQISGHLTPPFVDNGAMESIAMATVGSGGAASITFSDIPNTYTHLQLRFFVTNTPSGGESLYLRMGNGSIDTAGNYSWHQTYGYSGPSVGSSGIANATNIGIHYQATAPTYGTAGIIDIADYVSNAKFKTVRSSSAHDENSSTANAGQVFMNQGAWRSTAAITHLSFYFGGGNLPQYSTVALYGIKGA